jgi:hypothetical protein
LTASNLPANGSAKSAALTASTKFTITCAGEGVTASQDVTVTVNQPSSGGGGGGALTPGWLLALFGTLLLGRPRRRVH